MALEIDAILHLKIRSKSLGLRFAMIFARLTYPGTWRNGVSRMLRPIDGLEALELEASGLRRQRRFAISDEWLNGLKPLKHAARGSSTLLGSGLGFRPDLTLTRRYCVCSSFKRATAATV